MFSGMLLFDATPENVNKIVAAGNAITIPKAVTLHHFILQLQSRMLATMFTWANGDIPAGQKFLGEYISLMPELRHNTVSEKSLTQHCDAVPLKCLPWGGQHSVNIQSMSPQIIDLLMDALKTMPDEVNIGWSAPVTIDPEMLAKSCWGAGSHIFLSFADTVSQEEFLEEATRWTGDLFRKLRASKDPAVMRGGYVSLTKPGDITEKEILGERWDKAKELKSKFDRRHVFKYAIPRLDA